MHMLLIFVASALFVAQTTEAMSVSQRSRRSVESAFKELRNFNDLEDKTLDYAKDVLQDRIKTALKDYNSKKLQLSAIVTSFMVDLDNLHDKLKEAHALIASAKDCQEVRAIYPKAEAIFRHYGSFDATVLVGKLLVAVKFYSELPIVSEAKHVTELVENLVDKANKAINVRDINVLLPLLNSYARYINLNLNYQASNDAEVNMKNLRHIKEVLDLTDDLANEFLQDVQAMQNNLSENVFKKILDMYKLSISFVESQVTLCHSNDVISTNMVRIGKLFTTVVELIHSVGILED